MDFRTTWSVFGKATIMASFMLVAALWETMAVAEVNKDLVKAAKRGYLSEVQRLSLLSKGVINHG